ASEHPDVVAQPSVERVVDGRVAAQLEFVASCGCVVSQLGDETAIPIDGQESVRAPVGGDGVAYRDEGLPGVRLGFVGSLAIVAARGRDERLLERGVDTPRE